MISWLAFFLLSFRSLMLHWSQDYGWLFVFVRLLNFDSCRRRTKKNGKIRKLGCRVFVVGLHMFIGGTFKDFVTAKIINWRKSRHHEHFTLSCAMLSLNVSHIKRGFKWLMSILGENRPSFKILNREKVQNFRAWVKAKDFKDFALHNNIELQMLVGLILSCNLFWRWIQKYFVENLKTIFLKKKKIDNKFLSNRQESKLSRI